MVKTANAEYSGIPVESCNHCHNRGKRIGVTYQGLMEFPYGSPWNEKGMKQPKLHTKNGSSPNQVGNSCWLMASG